jgi:hypothetical protein
MKTFLASFLVITTLLAIVISGCSNDTTTPPCDGKGTVCIENKLDTVMTVTVQETHTSFVIHKDYIQCVSLAADQPYTFVVTSLNYNTDTRFMVGSCDNKLLIIKQ